MTKHNYTRKPVGPRFWAKVDKSDPAGCWPWTAYVMTNGYGQFKLDGKMQLVHRVAYELAVGPIPQGLEIDHVKARGCTRTDCCNPAHLEAVTGYVNNMRSNSRSAMQSRQTHCQNGHEFTPENTKRETDGSRKCRTCRLKYRRERYAMRNRH